MTQTQANEALTTLQLLTGKKATIVLMQSFCDSYHCTIEKVRTTIYTPNEHVVIISYVPLRKRKALQIMIRNHTSIAIYDGIQSPNTTTNEKVIKQTGELKMIDMGMGYDHSNFTRALASLDVKPIFSQQGKYEGV